MNFIKNKSESEEALVKDGFITVARRMYESERYCKEFIMYCTNLTEAGYEEVIKRTAVMDCARKFVSRYDISFFENELKLSEDEMKDLIKYKDDRD